MQSYPIDIYWGLCYAEPTWFGRHRIGDSANEARSTMFLEQLEEKQVYCRNE